MKVMEKVDFQVLFSSVRSVCNRTVLLCEHTENCDLAGFFHETLPYFDACIVIDHVQGEVLDVPEGGWPEKVLAYLRTVDPKSKRRILLEYAREAGAEWVCFMKSTECIDYRFDRIKHAIETSSVSSLAFYQVVCQDAEHYYDVDGSWNGFVCQPRMYQLSRCRDEEILNPESEVNRLARKETILLRTCVSEGQWSEYGINLFTRIYDLQGVYRVQDRFENNEMIRDEELPGMIERKLNVIGEYFLNKKERINYIGLYTGDSGVTLLLSQFYMWTGDRRYLDKMNEYLDHLTELIDRGEEIVTSFCNGLAGYGWLLCYLQDKGLIEVDEQVFAAIDEALEENIADLSRLRLYDQIHGLLSLGRYFLRRKNIRSLEYILTVMDEWMDQSSGEVKIDYGMEERPRAFHFGIAHGMAGILYFLGRCYHEGIKPDMSRRLADGIVAFFDHNEQDKKITGHYYPFCIPVDEYAEKRKNYRSRHAWCNGDLGVLYVTYLYARWIHDESLAKRTLDKLVVTTRDRDCQLWFVCDADWCHGSVSLAHFYNRLYVWTSNVLFKETAFYWLKATLILGRNAKAPTGYIFYFGSEGWRLEDDLLEGLSGVGLGLLSAVDVDSMDWDEAMMLS